MKKIAIIILTFLVLSTSVCAAPIKYEDPSMLDVNEPSSYEPYPIALNATSYTPWFTMQHMESADHYARGIRGGEGGQVVDSLAISPVNPNLMLMGSDWAGLWRSIDGGDSWYSITDNNNFRCVNDIVFHPTKENVVFCIQGTKGVDAASLTKLNNTDMDGVYRSLDGGHSWEHVLHATILSTAATHGVIAFDGSENVYALTNDGLYKSSDLGNDWENLGTIDSEKDGGIYSLWVSENGKTIITATAKSGISVSTSRGIFWESANGNLKPAASSFTVDPMNENHWFAIFTGESKRLFHSYDHGATWEPIEYYTYAEKNKPAVVRALYIPDKGITRHLEHLNRSFDHVVNNLGPHGLPLIGRADWNHMMIKLAKHIMQQ